MTREELWCLCMHNAVRAEYAVQRLDACRSYSLASATHRWKATEKHERAVGCSRFNRAVIFVGRQLGVLP